MKNIRLFFTAAMLMFAVFATFARTTITMEKEGGVYKVPCVVNGLRMKFIFDTGAANVCISESMAQYMLENDYLSKSDILGTGLSSVADGRIVDHVRIRLAYLEIGGLKLNDIEAIVIEGQASPLLLGQSAITKMGKVSINGNQLIIEEAGDCSDSEIDSWSNLADSYFDNAVYDKAINYYQRVYDCGGLSDFGIFIMGKCYSELGNYNQALSLFHALSQKIADRQTTLKYERWAGVYGEIAFCYYKMENYNACISYDEKALYYMPASEWEFEAETHQEMASCYYLMKEYGKADGAAIQGIGCILQNKYPSVYKEWERKHFKDLGSIMSKYRWGREEVLGNLIFILCNDFYNTMGEPHCQMTKIAAEMGSVAAQEMRNFWRSYGLCQ